MKDWSPDHPKAKLMAGKRAAILAAAKQSFLASGYEGTSMEGIAAAAGVSIMTLYRHAESKDDLFAAVIAMACNPSDEEEEAKWAALMTMPLGDVLAILGSVMQENLTSPETVALMRTVMAEATRFPHLAEMAYTSLIGHMQGFIEMILGEKVPGLGAPERKRLAELFVDRLMGTDLLRVLLGLGGISQSERRARSERARDAVLERLAERAEATG